MQRKLDRSKSFATVPSSTDPMIRHAYEQDGVRFDKDGLEIPSTVSLKPEAWGGRNLTRQIFSDTSWRVIERLPNGKIQVVGQGGPEPKPEPVVKPKPAAPAKKSSGKIRTVKKAGKSVAR